MKPTEGPYSLANHQILRGNRDKTHMWRIASVNTNFSNWEANARLLAKSWEMREALREIAEQKLSGEMHPEDYEMADFQEGYEACVKYARALLREIEGESE